MTRPPGPHGIDLARWRTALAEVSGQSFDGIARADVQLEGTVFSVPIHGIDAVWRALLLLESLHHDVRFIGETVVDASAHFAWEGRALGLAVQGMTTLELDDNARAARVIVHHRPFGPVVLLSATIAERLPPSRGQNGNGHGPSRS